MDVSLIYSGIDGVNHKLSAKTPQSIMEQLQGIKGYNGTFSDEIAANLANGFARKMNPGAYGTPSRINVPGMNRASLTPGGHAVNSEIVTGVSVDDNGNISISTSNLSVGEDGKVSRVSSKGGNKITVIPTKFDEIKKQVDETIKAVSGTFSDFKDGCSFSISFVTDVIYEDCSLKLKRATLNFNKGVPDVTIGGWETITTAVEETV